MQGNLGSGTSPVGGSRASTGAAVLGVRCIADVPWEPEGPTDQFRRRGRNLLALLLAALLLIAGRLADLQLGLGRRYAGLATGERLRVVAVPAPRGEILDRNGVVLAADRPSFAAALVPGGPPLSPSEAALLGRILGLSPAAVAAAQKPSAQALPYAPVILKTGLDPRQVTQVDEMANRLPGVVVEVQPTRFYPGSGSGYPGPDLAAQILGYVGAGGPSGQMVGRYGVEASYNGPLHLGGKTILGLQGVPGGDQVQVDPLGHPVRRLGEVPPRPGNNVVLTIDAHLQAVAQHALQANMAQVRRIHMYDGGPYPSTEGAAVAIDPQNGQILALASVPSFNPNDFVRGAQATPGSSAWKLWQSQWAALSSPKAPGRPLLDHALGDVSAPGSTFKPITSLAALSSHAITPTQRISCPAFLRVGTEIKHNWVPGNWVLDLAQALARSCDTYFYQVGALTGIQRIAAMARQFGLGQPTGLRALTGEIPGYVASPATQRMLGYRRRWVVSDTMDAAVGQGFNAFNPLEMANYVATLANGGTRYRPYLVKAITSPAGKVLWQNRPQVLSRVTGVPAADWAAVRQGMEDVVTYHRNWAGITDVPWGTAWVAFIGWRAASLKATGHVIPVAAKTGTAQQNGQVSNAWFIAYAPANHPTIAIAVFVKEGDEGLISGAPVARDMLDAYFGIPGFEVAQPNY
jgi:penicillin-binding protein 2